MGDVGVMFNPSNVPSSGISGHFLPNIMHRLRQLPPEMQVEVASEAMHSSDRYRSHTAWLDAIQKAEDRLADPYNKLLPSQKIVYDKVRGLQEEANFRHCEQSEIYSRLWEEVHRWTCRLYKDESSVVYCFLKRFIRRMDYWDRRNPEPDDLQKACYDFFCTAIVLMDEEGNRDELRQLVAGFVVSRARTDVLFSISADIDEWFEAIDDREKQLSFSRTVYEGVEYWVVLEHWQAQLEPRRGWTMSEIDEAQKMSADELRTLCCGDT